VTELLTGKEFKIEELCNQLKDKEEEHRRNSNKLNFQIVNMTDKVKNAEKDKKEIENKSEKFYLEIRKLRLKLAERGVNSAKGDGSEIVKDLLTKIEQLERQKEEMKDDLSNKETLLETTQKDELQQTIRIQKLESQISEISEKLKTVEKEKKKIFKDLTWAQSYYSGMDQKIKDLESELTKYKIESKSKQSTIVGGIVKLKIRRTDQ
jgi:chromosome segregation ATPase